MKQPTLADVHCTPLRFRPGDRILVRVFAPHDQERFEKLRKAVQHWAGPDVEIFVYSAAEMDIQVPKREKRLILE